MFLHKYVHSNNPGTNSYHGICSELNIPSSEIVAAQRDIDETLKVGAQVVHQIESYRILRVGRPPILVSHTPTRAAAAGHDRGNGRCTVIQGRNGKRQAGLASFGYPAGSGVPPLGYPTDGGASGLPRRVPLGCRSVLCGEPSGKGQPHGGRHRITRPRTAPTKPLCAEPTG